MSTQAPPSATVSMPISGPPLVAASPLRHAAYWSWAAGAPTASPPALPMASVIR
jgi:hypothetical protein